MQQRSWFLFIFLVFIGCKHKPNGPLYVECEPIIHHPYGIYMPYVTSYQTYKESATINPRNADEILCKELASNYNFVELNLINLKTKQKTLLTKNSIVYQAQWAANDWIIFGSGFQIYKIKSNGDNLTKLSKEGENFRPIVSPDGNFICWHNRTAKRNIIYDLNGIALDTMPQSMTGGLAAWSPDGTKIAGTTNNLNGTGHLVYYDLNDSKKQHIIAANIANNRHGMTWVSNSELMISYFEFGNPDAYIVFYDLTTGTKSTGKTCSLYSDLSLYPDGEHVLLCRDYVKSLEDYKLYREKELYKMNVRTLNISHIPID